MPSTQELLQAITGMQQNAQAALPVIPNNGNPHGANNMPNNPDGPVGEAVANSPYFHEWMRPSPAVDMINKMLSAPLHQPASLPEQPIIPSANTGIVPRPNDLPTPVMPQRNHAWGDARRAARAEGDFPMMPKRGQAIGSVEQPILPTMPRTPFNERY